MNILLACLYGSDPEVSALEMVEHLYLNNGLHWRTITLACDQYINVVQCIKKNLDVQQDSFWMEHIQTFTPSRNLIHTRKAKSFADWMK